MRHINCVRFNALMMNVQVCENLQYRMNIPKGLEGISKARFETSVLSVGIRGLVPDPPNTAAGNNMSVSLGLRTVFPKDRMSTGCITVHLVILRLADLALYHDVIPILPANVYKIFFKAALGEVWQKIHTVGKLLATASPQQKVGHYVCAAALNIYRQPQQPLKYWGGEFSAPPGSSLEEVSENIKHGEKHR